MRKKNGIIVDYKMVDYHCNEKHQGPIGRVNVLEKG
jgi:hypothetical protein